MINKEKLLKRVNDNNIKVELLPNKIKLTLLDDCSLIEKEETIPSFYKYKWIHKFIYDLKKEFKRNLEEENTSWFTKYEVGVE